MRLRANDWSSRALTNRTTYFKFGTLRIGTTEWIRTTEFGVGHRER